MPTCFWIVQVPHVWLHKDDEYETFFLSLACADFSPPIRSFVNIDVLGWGFGRGFSKVWDGVWCVFWIESLDYSMIKLDMLRLRHVVFAVSGCGALTSLTDYGQEHFRTSPFRFLMCCFWIERLCAVLRPIECGVVVRKFHFELLFANFTLSCCDVAEGMHRHWKIFFWGGQVRWRLRKVQGARGWLWLRKVGVAKDWTCEITDCDKFSNS